MKKLLLTLSALLPLLVLVTPAHAQNYTYNCLCLFSDPSGSCMEYTCDAYRQQVPSYYHRSCDYRYDNCGSSSYRPTTYRPTYRSPYNSSTYSNGTYGSSYGNLYNNGYYRQYTNQPTYYGYPSYNDYNYYPYYY